MSDKNGCCCEALRGILVNLISTAIYNKFKSFVSIIVFLSSPVLTVSNTASFCIIFRDKFHFWVYLLVFIGSFIVFTSLSVCLYNIIFRKESWICDFPSYNQSTANYYIHTFTTDNKGDYISFILNKYLISSGNELYLLKCNGDIVPHLNFFSFAYNLEGLRQQGSELYKGISGNFAGYNKDKNVITASFSYFCSKCNGDDKLIIEIGHLYRLHFFDRIYFLLKFKLFSFRSFFSKRREELEFEYCKLIKDFFDEKMRNGIGDQVDMHNKKTDSSC